MGDTFVHGRLANPPHPLWRSFETFHVLWFPTYASKYPPAQGLVLALGQLLGDTWIGVLLSGRRHGRGVCLGLAGVDPPRWAFLAGVLTALRLCVASYGSTVIGAAPWPLLEERSSSARLGASGAGHRSQWNSALLWAVAILFNSRRTKVYFLQPIGAAFMFWFGANANGRGC